jgi:hypothetical protein
MRKNSSTRKINRVITWGDLIEATEEIIRRNKLKIAQLEALSAHLRSHQRADNPLPMGSQEDGELY